MRSISPQFTSTRTSVGDLHPRRMGTEQNDLAVVTHEMRTPLTPIKAALSLVLEARGDRFDDETVELLSLCERNADSLIGMVSDILDSSRAEHHSDSIGTVRADEVATDVARELAPLAREQNVTVTVGAAQRCEAVAAEDGLRGVMVNLLGNALKYAPNSHVHVAVANTNDGVRISVRDNGPGIPDEKLDSVFDPYTRLRTHAAKQGTGLGLAITRSLVEKFGGRIHAESMLGVGTTFVVTLKSARHRRSHASPRAMRFAGTRS